MRSEPRPPTHHMHCPQLHRQAAQAVLSRDVFSVVRDSRMWCPDEIGRDSWVWGEQGTLRNINSPHEVGEEALTEKIPLSGGHGVALG